MDSHAEATRIFDRIVDSAANDIEIEVEEDDPLPKEEVDLNGSSNHIDSLDYNLLPTK